ncbi:HD domain-containing protein [Candidatus Woesebacteria bacterium]|nr:HD domain-containing protein [Candidatus Woesebacteria bacterium]
MKDLINFFYEVGSLRQMERSHKMHMLQKVESVAEHSQRVTIIAYLLAKKAKANPHKTMIMAAFHDIPESRTGDSNWHQKEYVSQDEEKAWEAQLKLIGEGSDEIKKIIKEYRERKTYESQLAKDADNIDYVLSLKELALTGNAEAQRRLKEDVFFGHLYTSIGKKVMKEVIKSKPNQWYQCDRKKTHKKYTVKPTKSKK